MTSQQRPPVKKNNPNTKQKTDNFFGLTNQQLLIGAGIIIVVIVVAGLGLLAVLNGGEERVFLDGLESYNIPSAQHVENRVSYPQTPPVGGNHFPVWQNCSVYTEPLVSEYAVHSLEHGAVWITYQPSLPEDQIETLQDITRRGSHRLLSPYPGIDSPVVLSAWGYQLRVQSADDPRVMEFIRRFEQGPQTPEPGASCSQGETRTASDFGL